MRENVNEEEAIVFEKLRYFLQQQLIVFHVLKHLHGHDAVKRAAVFVVDLHGGDVASFDTDVEQLKFCSTLFDVLLLRRGI